MPRGDGSGPMGEGSMTGRGLGYCAGNDRPGFFEPGSGLGRGRGFGRGARRRARGRSFLGRARRFFGFGQSRGQAYSQPSKEEEKKFLQEDKKALEQELKDVKQRLEEI